MWLDRETLRAIFEEIHQAARAVVAPFTRGGKLDLSTPNKVGHLPASNGGTGTADGAEPPLGNPAANGYVLSSTTVGVRSWVPQDGDGDAVLSGDGAIPSMLLPSSQEGGTVPEVGRWVKQGTILEPTEGYEDTAVQEPSIIVTEDEIRLYYTAGWDTTGIALATCPLTDDPTDPGNWTKQGLVLGNGGSGYAPTAGHFGVLLDRDTGTYYCYFSTPLIPGPLRVATSADGITFGTPAVAIAANQVAWADWWVNPNAWKEGGDWKMLVVGRLGASNWFAARATSTDGLAWTIQGAGPLTTLEVHSGGTYDSGWLAYPGRRGGLYHLWYHATDGTDTIYLPTNIYHATSPDLITWTRIAGTTPVLAYLGVAPEVDQVADAAVIELTRDGETRSYLFYDALDNPNEESVIRVATIDATLAQVVDEAPRLDISTPLTTEQVQDIVGAMALAGPGLTVAYSDGAGTVTYRTAESFGVTFTVAGNVALLGDGSIATKVYV